MNTQRQIKFRYRVRDLNDNHEIVYYKTLKEIEAGLVVLNHKSYMILSCDQFTGLLDKNGKEIYEGDIMQVKGEKEKCEVRFENGGFYRVWIGTSITAPIKDLLDIFEIIGNIYEHPNLITHPNDHE